MTYNWLIKHLLIGEFLGDMEERMLPILSPVPEPRINNMHQVNGKQVLCGRQRKNAFIVFLDHNMPNKQLLAVNQYVFKICKTG